MVQVKIDKILGESDLRYFARGYRVPKSKAKQVTLWHQTDKITISADCSIVYPTESSTSTQWSRHLSTIDAVRLFVIVLESTESKIVDFNDYWIMEITLKAGPEPWTDLEKIPIAMEIDIDHPGNALQVNGKVGNIRGVIKFHKYNDEVELLSRSIIARSVYGEAHQDLFGQIRVLSTSKPNVIDGSVEYQLPNSNTKDFVSGVESRSWPSPTMLELISAMGQLTQAVICLDEAIKRPEIDNLWMRSMKITRNMPPKKSQLCMGTSTEIISKQEVNVNGEIYKTMKISSKSSLGHEASAAVAYRRSGKR